MSKPQESNAGATEPSRRDWLKVALGAGVLVAGSAVLDKAHAAETTDATKLATEPTIAATKAPLAEFTTTLALAGAADAMAVLDWHHGFELPETAWGLPDVELKHGRCDHQDLSVTKAVDAATGKLRELVVTGKPLEHAKLVLAQGGVVFAWLELAEVTLSSVSLAASGGAQTTETVTLHYNKIKWTYVLQGKGSDAPGGGKGTVSTGWDLEKNAKL